jgi:hypothetical protein
MSVSFDTISKLHPLAIQYSEAGLPIAFHSDIGVALSIQSAISSE